MKRSTTPLALAGLLTLTLTLILIPSLGAQDEEPAPASDTAYHAAYPRHISFTPLLKLREGSYPLNIFSARGWATGLYGINAGATMQDLGPWVLESATLSAWYGIGGLGSFDAYELQRLDTDWSASGEALLGTSFNARLALDRVLVLDLGIIGDRGLSLPDGWYRLTGGLTWRMTENPNLPFEGYSFRVGASLGDRQGNEGTNTTMDGTLRGWLPLGESDLVLLGKLSAATVLGKGQPDFAQTVDAHRLSPMLPQYVFAPKGSYWLGTWAASLQAGLRLEVLTLPVPEHYPEVDYPRDRAFYLEPYAYAASAGTSTAMDDPRYGLGLGIFMVNRSGAWTDSPLGLDLSLDISRLSTGGWFSFAFYN